MLLQKYAGNKLGYHELYGQIGLELGSEKVGSKDTEDLVANFYIYFENMEYHLNFLKTHNLQYRPLPAQTRIDNVLGA